MRIRFILCPFSTVIFTVNSSCNALMQRTFKRHKTHASSAHNTYNTIQMYMVSKVAFDTAQSFHTVHRLLLLLQPFNSLFSRTTWVSRHQKGKPFCILLEQMTGWQWHQLDHMQIICTSLQIDNHAHTSPFSFYRPDALPASQPTMSKH